MRAAAAFTAVWMTASATSQEAAPRAIEDPDSYAIYSILLPDQWPVKVNHAKAVLFQQETAIYSGCKPSVKTAELTWRPVVEAFLNENARPQLLLEGRSLSLPYSVVPSAIIQAALREHDDPWVGFGRRYQNVGSSYMVVSAVGFDQGRTRALVYMAHHQPTAGGGAYYFLEKGSGSWQKTKNRDGSACSWSAGI